MPFIIFVGIGSCAVFQGHTAKVHPLSGSSRFFCFERKGLSRPSQLGATFPPNWKNSLHQGKKDCSCLLVPVFIRYLSRSFLKGFWVLYHVCSPVEQTVLFFMDILMCSGYTFQSHHSQSIKTCNILCQLDALSISNRLNFLAVGPCFVC